MGAPIVLVTAIEARDVDEDMPLLLDAFGGDAVVEAWDDPDVDWGAHPLAIIRSTWDYTTRRDEFLAWAERVAGECRLVHDPAVLRWNTDKRYLADLATAGIAIVPSTFVDAEPYDLLSGELVVKPTVSAGSRDTARYAAHQGDAARAHIDELLASGRTALVQPYLAEVDRVGETAVICFGGEVSHAITKGPLLALDAPPSRALFAPELITPCELEADEVSAAKAVLDALSRITPVSEHLAPPLYARVDLLRTDERGLAVLEVELSEPSLFLASSPGAADRFAAAIRARF